VEKRGDRNGEGSREDVSELMNEGAENPKCEGKALGWRGKMAARPPPRNSRPVVGILRNQEGVCGRRARAGETAQRRGPAIKHVREKRGGGIERYHSDQKNA